MNRDEPIPRELAALLAAERSIPPAPPAAIERVRARLEATLASAPASVGASALSTKLIISVVLAVVGVTGVIAYLGLHDRAPSPAARDDTPEPPPSPVDVEPIGEHTAHREPAVAAQGEPGTGPTAPRPHRGEREILDEAMRCMSRGSAACALTEVAAHAREYPNGALVEEREAIRVEALELAGDIAAAQERARAFLVRYPTSIHVTRVRQIAEPH